MMVRLMRAVGDPQMAPTRVELVWPKPVEGDQPCRDYFSCQQVLDSTRQSPAACYIEQSSFAITEIAYMLGFSDAANFTRAFKRWKGKSPLGFRKSLGLP